MSTAQQNLSSVKLSVAKTTNSGPEQCYAASTYLASTTPSSWTAILHVRLWLCSKRHEEEVHSSIFKFGEWREKAE